MLRSVHSTVRREDLPTVTAGETWTAYVRRITSGLPRKDVAAAANINVSAVSRWLGGVSRPSPEKVIEFARGLNQAPLEALIAAGYLRDTDINGAVSIVQSLTTLSDDALVDELRDRLQVKRSATELLGPIGQFGDKSKRGRRPQ